MKSLPTTEAPAYPEYGIIALVPNDWSSRWMGRHQVLSRMARYVHTVWVQPPRNWRTVLHSGNGKREPVLRRDDPTGLLIYRHQNWLPEFYRPDCLANWTHDQRLKRVRKLLLDRGCRRILLSIWKPQYARAIESLPHDLSSYHMSDEYTYSDDEQPVDPLEADLISKVDRVFVQSPGLMARKGDFNPSTYFLPNGVDFKSLSRSHPIPEDLRGIQRPIIGYTGYIKRQVNWELIDQLSTRRPDWSFVFVGAVKPDPSVRRILSTIEKRDNVHFLGAKSSTDLVKYPRHFDVCMMPYRVNAYTNCIYPLKLHEYLASGKPVIGSPIRTLEDFSDVVEIPAESAASWVASIERLLHAEEISAERVAERQSVALEHDWEQLTRRMLVLLAEGLHDKTGDPLYEMLCASEHIQTRVRTSDRC